MSIYLNCHFLNFDGSVLKYREFCDMFNNTVHSCTSLSDVEKLTYLKECLVGEALDAVSGYQVTSVNYPVVRKLLEERFGDTQKALNAHYVALMNAPVATNKTSSLRSLYDYLEEHLRKS